MEVGPDASSLMALVSTVVFFLITTKAEFLGVFYNVLTLALSDVSFLARWTLNSFSSATRLGCDFYSIFGTQFEAYFPILE